MITLTLSLYIGQPIFFLFFLFWEWKRENPPIAFLYILQKNIKFYDQVLKYLAGITGITVLCMLL